MDRRHHQPPRRSAYLRTALTGVLTAAVVMTGCSPTPPAGSPSPATPADATPTGSIGPSTAPPAGALAAPAQAYVDAVNAGDLDALVAAFAPDGQVTDVTRPISGRDAIRTWARNEVIGGRLQVLSVTAMPGGQDLLVHWAPQGSPGWRAHYRFTMTATAITLADLQYA